jgi:hypothetical protein
MSLDINDWREFRLGCLFAIKKGKRLTSEEQTIGNTPYIGAIDSNNGVANYIGQEAIHDGNTISLSYNGSVGEAFYQETPFWATDDVNVLYFKEENGVPFNKHIALFICTILQKEKYRYSYGRKWVLDNMLETLIKLPSNDRGKPDWVFIEDYMKSLNYKPLTTKNLTETSLPLEISKWEEFSVEDIFKIYNGKGITKEEIECNEGSFIAVQSGEEDNGVIGRIDKDYCVSMNYTMTEAPCLTVARSGSAGFISYQPYGCVVGDSAKILVLRDREKGNSYTYLFLKTILMANKFKYTYGRKVTEAKYLEEKIMLPIVSKGMPDFKFMEQYMKSLPYGDRVV